MKVNDRNSISLDATPLGVNGPDLEITDDREAVVTQPDNNILFGIQNNKEKNPLLADEAVISPSTANKYVSNGTSLDEKKCVELFSDEHHAEWRKGFEKREGVGARRLKPLRDGTLFNINVPFSQLHPERQAESKAAGNSAMKALSMYVSCYDWNEKMAQEYLHINYIKRNKKMFEKVNLVIAEKLPKWAKDNNEGSLRIMREIQSQNLLCTKAAASEFHETWREEFKLKNGNVPRMKDNPDGTQIDINKPFDQLNMHWQRENLLAAHAARVGCILFPEHSGPDADEMVYHYYHEQWRERNAKTSDNEKCHVPYGELLKNDALKNEAIKVTKQVKRMRCMITLWDPRVYKCAKALHEKFRATSSGNCIALKANRDGSVENVNVEFDELHLDQKKDYLVQMHIALRVCKTRLKSNSKPILLKEIYDKEYCIEYGRTNEEYRVKVDSSDISIGTKMYKDLTKAEKAHVRDMITIALDEVKVDPAIGIYSSRSRVKDFTREMSLKKLLRQEALIKAVWTPSVDYKFEKILAEEDEKANDSDLCFEDPFNNNGMTLFHYAVRSGNRDVIDYLMGRVDQLILENPSKDSFTPLIWASYLNDDITVTSLLEKKVNVDAADKVSVCTNFSFIYLLIFIPCIQDGWTALMWATCMGHIKVVEILLKNKAYVLASETHNGWTALTLACRIHYWKILQHLLDNLKLPGDKKLSDLIDFDGWNLLHHTVAMKRLPNQTDQETTSCLFKLLSNDRKFDVNAPTCRLSTEEVDLELTPMHIAASNGLFKHVQLLAYVSTPKKGDNKYGIEALCKLVTKRSQKVKPIYLAAIYDDYDEVVKFLLKREAAEYAKKQSADNWKSTLLRLFDDIHRVITSKDVTDIQEAAFRDHMKVVNAFLHYPAVMETGFRKETLIQYLVGIYRIFFLLIYSFTFYICKFIFIQYKHAMRFWESMSIWIDDKYKGTNDYKIWIENFRFEDNTLLEAYDFEVHFKHKYVSFHVKVVHNYSTIL